MTLAKKVLLKLQATQHKSHIVLKVATIIKHESSKSVKTLELV